VVPTSTGGIGDGGRRNRDQKGLKDTVGHLSLTGEGHATFGTLLKPA
jgi:hypothetical protein